MRELKLSAINERLMPASNKAIIQAYLDTLNEKRESANLTKAQRRDAIIASTRSRDAAVAYAGAREERINAYFWAENFAANFFEYRPLGQDEWIEIVNQHDMGYNFLETDVHGSAPHQTWVKKESVTSVETYMLTTGIIKWPILHIQRGRIDVSAEVDVQAQRSIDQQMNTDFYTLIDAAITSFPAAALIKDSRIVSATLPTTNSLSNTGEDAFTYQILRDIVDHFMLLGRSLKAIVINPVHMKETWDWQELVSTTSSGSQDGRAMVTTKVREGIMERGRPSGMILGQEFTWILDPTRAKKFALCFSDQPAGILWEKTDLSIVDYFDRRWMKGAGYGDNFEGVEHVKVVKPYILDPQRLNFMKIVFDD